MSEIRQVVVIGSGPAGYTAALHTACARLKPLLFGSSIFVSGSLTTTTEVENFVFAADGRKEPTSVAARARGARAQDGSQCRASPAPTRH